MLIYLFVYIVALVAFFILAKPSQSSGMFLSLFFLYVVIFIGLGDMIGGYDRYIYGEMFDLVADELRGSRDMETMMSTVQGNEYGYFAWEYVVAHVTSNRYVFILLSTLLMYVLYFIAFRTCIENYPVATLMFLGLFYYFTMTYFRQVLACGFIWIGIKYVWERKFIKFMLFLVLAYSFHSSALIFFPFYFVPIRKYSYTVVISVMIVALLLGLTSIPSMLLSESSDSRSTDYTRDISGGRIEYVLEAVFFLALIFWNYTRIPETKKDLVLLNSSIAFCAVLLFFIRFGQGGRIAWYFMIGLFYTFSRLAQSATHGRDIKGIVLILSLFLFLRVSFLWAFNLTPYKTFLSDGFPSGDRWIYDKYEYDSQYTQDKLYRPLIDFVW
jgi:hypothetical protein